MDTLINAQTAGPIAARGYQAENAHGHHVFSFVSYGRDDPESISNAALAVAGFNAFDKAGRELGIDAARLAEKLDLSSLLCLVRLINEHAQSPLRDALNWDGLRDRLAPFVALLPPRA